jgi:hypothetical protein
MACDDYLRFKGSEHIGDDQLISRLENSLKMWLDWCFLGIGGWTDVNIPESGNYGGDFSTLALVDEPSFADGKVWQTARKDWVWETGVNYENDSVVYNPIEITGVEVDGNTYDTGDATYGHYYNYPLGRVVFNSAIDTDSVVRLSYSFRDIQVYTANQGDWASIQQNSLRPDDSHFAQSSMGEWSIGGQHRIQMPAILIETVSNRIHKPWEMGSGSFEVSQPVLFHIFAQDKYWRDNLTDRISIQDGKTIFLFNTNLMGQANAFPLDYRGMLVGSKNYPDFVSPVGSGGYRWKRCKFSNATISEINTNNSNLYHSVVRMLCQIKYP